MLHLLSEEAAARNEPQARQKLDAKAQRKARSQNRRDFKAVMEACRSAKCLRAALLASFGQTLPPGACAAAGSAGCSVCSDVRLAEASIVALGYAESQNDLALNQLRTTILQGPTGRRELDFDGYLFGVPSDEERSSDKGGTSDEEEDPDAGLAADVALGARGGGAERTFDALAAAEARTEAARGGAGGGRSALAAGLFAHRKPLPPPARAAPPPAAPAPQAARAVDAVQRDVWRAKLLAALGGDAAAAAKAELDVFERCRGVPSQYNRFAQQTELDAKRAATRPAGAPGQQAGAPAMRRGFVPPRTVLPPQKAEAPPPPPPKLKSTRIGDPLPSELWAAKQAKTTD